MTRPDRDHRVDDERDEDTGERRRDHRHVACFPALLEAGARAPRRALIRDLSVSGALLLTRARYDVGDELTLRLHIEASLEVAHEAVARVVRVDPLGPREAGLWTRTVAVRFLAPLTALEPQIAALAARQESARRGVGPAQR